MKKDQLITRRRALIAGAAVLGAAGAAGTAHVLTAGQAAQPASGPPLSGPQANRALKPSAYRLQPLTGYGPPHGTQQRTLVRHEPFMRVSGRGRTMVLTFDDGPDPTYTPEILRTLREYDVHAMFFVCGLMAAGNKDLLGEMADDGHIVGNHTWSHPLLTKLSRSAIRSEIERTSEVIDEAYGEPPKWFRAPYGEWNRATYQIGAELGMEPMAWTIDTNDWARPGTRAIVGTIQKEAAPGVVVLSHDAGGDRSQSVQALRTYLPRLLDAGYHITVPRRRDA